MSPHELRVCARLCNVQPKPAISDGAFDLALAEKQMNRQ